MKATDKAILPVLDLLTIGGPEALPGKRAAAAMQLRDILGSQNTVGVGIGEKITEGRSTGRLALRFYVKRKVSLRRLMAREAVPPAIHPDLAATDAAIPTDVIVLGQLRLDSASITPGDSIGHYKISAGTLGALVKRKNDLMVLSNSHVLALGGKAKKGDAILSPARDDGGKSPADLVARLAAFKKFVTGGAFVNTADCAIAKPTAGRADLFRSMIPGVGVPRGVATAVRGMKIVKVGRTTGKTFGVVHDVHFRFVFQYEGVGKVGFLDQVLCSRYSSPGDSGSLVLDKASKRAVGLHFASAPQGSVFSPIADVLQALAVTLVTQKV